MKIRKFLFFLGLLLTITFLIAHRGRTEPLFPYVGGPPKPGTNPPIITSAFAVDKGGYGYMWKIYIEAEAGDVNMSRIASVVDQPGFGRYPTDWIILKPQDQRRLRGYIQWNLRSAGGYHQEWTQITLKVSIFDKAGNKSNVAVFPFTFESGVKDQYKYKLPPPFDQGDTPELGYINIYLFPLGGLGIGGPK